MKRITDEDIININEIYFRIKTYSGTAKETGFSPATVKKYVIIDYKPKEKIIEKKFDINLISELPRKINISEIGEFCMLSENEYDEVYEFRKELLI